MTDDERVNMTHADFRYRLASVASKYSMPSKSKLDGLGIDVDVKTLKSWQDAQLELAKFQYTANATKVIDAMLEWAKLLAEEAMSRTAQKMAQTVMTAEGWRADE